MRVVLDQLVNKSGYIILSNMPVSKSLKRKRYQPKLSPIQENNRLNKNHYKRIYKNPLIKNTVDNLDRDLFNAWLRILQYNANKSQKNRIPIVLYGSGGNKNNFVIKDPYASKPKLSKKKMNRFEFF